MENADIMDADQQTEINRRLTKPFTGKGAASSTPQHRIEFLEHTIAEIRDELNSIYNGVFLDPENATDELKNDLIRQFKTWIQDLLDSINTI